MTKKKIIGGITALALVVAIALNININSKSNNFSDVFLANVEALAQNEGMSGHACYDAYETQFLSNNIHFHFCDTSCPERKADKVFKENVCP